MVLMEDEEKYNLQNRIPSHHSTSIPIPSSSRHQPKLVIFSKIIFISTLIYLSSFSFNSFFPSKPNFYSSKLPIGLSSHRSVRWLECSDQSHPTFVCAYVNVPKDYTNSSNGIASIALAKLPATSKPEQKLGAIFLNPGGPGGSGFQFAFHFADHLSFMLDGRYDIIGFDPRGIGKTKPLISCFGPEFQYDLFKSHTVLENGISIPPNILSKTDEELNFKIIQKQIEEQQSLRKTQFERCGEIMGEEELRHMSTNTVVLDIDRMSKILYGDEAPINFFGGSYGTILGAYLVNILPAKRIGKVLIDGVASAPDWANKPPYLWLHDWLKYTNTAYEWFLNDCSKAGPSECPLSKFKNEHPKEISKRLEDFLDKLYDSPASIPKGIRPGILTSGAARSQLYLSTNLPSLWPLFAELFAEALDGDLTRLYNSRISPFPKDNESKDETDLSRAAVVCGDSPPYEIDLTNGDFWKKPSSQVLTEEIFRTLRDRSKEFGASVSQGEPDGGCENHPANIKGPPTRFTGPWNNSLETPMLIVSNTADPITPLSSGQEINELMGQSSRLLIQDSPGHCSLGSISNCTTTHYRRYFLEGYLPEDNFKCGVDRGYFPIKYSLKSLELNEMSHSERRTKGWNDWVLSQM